MALAKSQAPGRPLSEVRSEGVRIAEAANASGIDLRLTGGVAVSLRSPSSRCAPLVRRHADIDCVGRTSDRKHFTTLMADLGYQADERFNTVHGATRQYYWDATNGRQVDIFLDRVEMCHVLDLRARLTADPGGVTLALADLLLMKLQIVETNEKDLLDVLALLVDHDFGQDDSGINIGYLGELAGADWGLWRTITTIAERARGFACELRDFEHRDRIRAQVDHFLGALEVVPKSTRWRLRAVVGERRRWYELPEEAH
jgi:hypothetical protein